MPYCYIIRSSSFVIQKHGLGYETRNYLWL